MKSSSWLCKCTNSLWDGNLQCFPAGLEASTITQAKQVAGVMLLTAEKEEGPQLASGFKTGSVFL